MSLSPIDFKLPEDAAAIISEGVKCAHKHADAHANTEMLDTAAACLYRQYFLATRRISQKEKDLRRPLLYAAIKAAAALCTIAQRRPQPPAKDVFDKLIAQDSAGNTAMNIEADVLTKSVEGFYKRFFHHDEHKKWHPQLGKKLVDCLDAAMTQEEISAKGAIIKALKGMFSTAANENTKREDNPPPSAQQQMAASATITAQYI